MRRRPAEPELQPRLAQLLTLPLLPLLPRGIGSSAVGSFPPLDALSGFDSASAVACVDIANVVLLALPLSIALPARCLRARRPVARVLLAQLVLVLIKGRPRAGVIQRRGAQEGRDLVFALPLVLELWAKLVLRPSASPAPPPRTQRLLYICPPAPRAVRPVRAHPASTPPPATQAAVAVHGPRASGAVIPFPGRERANSPSKGWAPNSRIESAPPMTHPAPVHTGGVSLCVRLGTCGHGPTGAVGLGDTDADIEFDGECVGLARIKEQHPRLAFLVLVLLTGGLSAVAVIINHAKRGIHEQTHSHQRCASVIVFASGGDRDSSFRLAAEVLPHTLPGG
ncbi:hypothetical protein MSAN_00442800 [Mycena sanguinolenta]|uniref:Uncharacterized protein n=1 Tax=Mycena sanguinolenta TaxID=230812 RepID=A0A8H6ZFY4_9AGAR|nr:hypothetical protein MSAN_00442800 [Mycena sanguinolenta]